MRMNGNVALAAGATAVLAVLAACSDGATAPASAKRVATPSFAVTVPAVVLGQITVCKDGNANGTFSVSRADVGGAHGGVSPATTSSPTINTGTCALVASDGSVDVNVGSDVTITENAAANTVQTITGCRFLAAGGVEQDCTNFTANPRFINSYHGYVVTYTNTFTPPTGNQGCTPGYWKQDQHFDSYPAGITPSTLFSSIFGVGGSLTFLQALGLNGGDVNALWRHGAAAYLNALSGDVNYAYTTAQVIAIVNGTGAYSGLTVEQRKNLLDAANNGVGGCPLN